MGSPESVIEQLDSFQEESGAAGVIVGAGGQWGAMPSWMAMKEHADHGGGGHASLPPTRREADLGA